MKGYTKPIPVLLLVMILMQVGEKEVRSQGIQFSLYFDPLIGWVSSDTGESRGDGARPGYSFGLQFDRYFTENYAFSTGIGLTLASARVNYADTMNIRFKNSSAELMPDENITYNIQYLSVPLGLKLKTNQIGYLSLFTNVGLDPKVVIGAKANLPSLNIEKENITEELRDLVLGFHVTIGTEYSLGGSTALLFGIRYENNFTDFTKDFSDQPEDKLSMQYIRFRLGLNF